MMSSIREAIISAWVPPLADFAPHEGKAVMRLMAEMTSATQVGLWTAIPVAAAKITEALLRKKLALVGAETAAAKLNGLGQLIDLARARGALSGYDFPRRGSSSLTAAAILRNWEAHFNAWNSQPSELRAIQSQALMVCATEALFPPPQTTFTGTADVSTNWRDLSPSVILTMLSKNDDRWMATLLVDFESVSRHVLRFSSLQSVNRYDKLVTSRAFPAELFQRAIEAEFGHLVARAAQARAKDILATIDLLKRRGLREHANVFGILLPLDEAVVSNLLRHSAASAIFYLTACYRSERALFAKRLKSVVTNKKIVADFWRGAARWRAGNIGNLLITLPPRLRWQLVAGASRSDIAAVLRGSPVVDAIKLLRAFPEQLVTRDPHLLGIRQEAVAAVSTTVQTMTLADLHMLPRLMHGSRLLSDSAGERILEQILLQIEASSPTTVKEWDSFARILWDVNLYAENQRHLAIGIARAVLLRTSVVPPWHGLWLVGLLTLTGNRDGVATSPHASQWHIDDDADHASVNRWHAYAVALGLDALEKPIPRTLVRRIEETIQPEASFQSPLTTNIIAQVYKLLSKVRAA